MHAHVSLTASSKINYEVDFLSKRLYLRVFLSPQVVKCARHFSIHNALM